MKLEVGMYVRTNEGKITKIIEIDKDGFERVDKCIDFTNYNITKASNNIIDLIEVGDIVVSLNASNILEYNLLTLSNIDELKDLWNIQGNIKSIVTKQQFESMQYRIGD